MLWQRLLGWPVSESGRLRHGDGDPEGGNGSRRGLVLDTLSHLEAGYITVSGLGWVPPD